MINVNELMRRGFLVSPSLVKEKNIDEKVNSLVLHIIISDKEKLKTELTDKKIGEAEAIAIEYKEDEDAELEVEVKKNGCYRFGDNGWL